MFFFVAVQNIKLTVYYFYYFFHTPNNSTINLRFYTLSNHFTPSYFNSFLLPFSSINHTFLLLLISPVVQVCLSFQIQ